MTLALLDVITTHIGLKLGFQEANPVMREVIEQWWGVAIKLVATLIVAILIQWAWNRYNVESARIALLITAIVPSSIILMAAVLWNTSQIILFKIN